MAGPYLLSQSSERRENVNEKSGAGGKTAFWDCHAKQGAIHVTYHLTKVEPKRSKVWGRVIAEKS